MCQIGEERNQTLSDVHPLGKWIHGQRPSKRPRRTKKDYLPPLGDVSRGWKEEHEK